MSSPVYPPRVKTIESNRGAIFLVWSLCINENNRIPLISRSYVICLAIDSPSPPRSRPVTCCGRCSFSDFLAQGTQVLSNYNGTTTTQESWAFETAVARLCRGSGGLQEKGIGTRSHLTQYGQHFQIQPPQDRKRLPVIPTQLEMGVRPTRSSWHGVLCSRRHVGTDVLASGLLLNVGLQYRPVQR